MKVLWITNMVLPQVAKALNLGTSFSGGWLVDYASRLASDPEIELAIMTYARVPKDMDAMACGIRSFIFAGGGKRLLFHSQKNLRDCKRVIDAFKPDLIHIHGTEYAPGYGMVKLATGIPTLLTIQGVLSRISEEYYGGFSFGEILQMGKIKEYMKLKAPVFAKRLFCKNAKREQYVLRHVKYVTGRTDWDRAVMLSVNPKLKYYRSNYNLRAPFYTASQWSLENVDRHTVYTGAATYSLKGLHILIRALALVKKEYPDVKLLVPVNNKNPKKGNGYERYILKLIERLGLTENVSFIGRKSAEEVAEILSHAHACVVPSAMEGASATMCEAMMVGTPGICAYRGGMTALLRDGESGFFYDFDEHPVLADRLCKLFSDDALCVQFSKMARADAEARHDKDVNYTTLKSIYREVLEENNHASV